MTSPVSAIEAIEKADRCKFSTYGYACGKHVEHGRYLCEEHAKAKCASCGQPATHGCDFCGQFVCGTPLCDECTFGTDSSKPAGAWGFINHIHVSKPEFADKHENRRLKEENAALARQAEALQREITELRKKLDACDWYWPEDDTSSDACADGPWQIAENCDLPPGEVLAYSRGGVVETRFYAYLPPADDSDSDDEFEVDAETELAVKQAIEAENARRARALLGGENAE